jgi:negative regulator of replication initiation
MCIIGGLALANADRLLKVGYSTETTTMGAEFVQKARDSATEAQASANEAKRVSQEIQTMREDLRNVIRSLLVNLVYIDQTTSRATVRQEAFTDLLTQLNNLAVFAYPDKTERHAAMSKLFTQFPPVDSRPMVTISATIR